MSSDVTKMYNFDYQKSAFDEKTIAASDWIAGVLKHRYQPTSVLDVGSGAGALVEAFRKREVKAIGLDGSEHAAIMAGGSVLHRDLRDPFDLEERFDLITCFDVAEHIDERAADTFLKNIERHLARVWHAKLIFGPARDGQEGLGHVNCQHPLYWVHKIQNLGLFVLPKESETLRTAIKEHPAHAHLWWVAQNLMMFGRRA